MLVFRRFISDAANRVKFGGVRHALWGGSHLLPSLFIVSLPRSFSSYTYLLTRSALRLRQPEFTTFGEILNCCRFNKGCGHSGEVPSSFFLRQERDSAAFRQSAAFLDRVVEARGFAYKDVVQPFVLAAWLRGRRGLRILHIRRNIADVAMAMFELEWLYPAAAANAFPDVKSTMLAGLVLADEALSRLPAVSVDYDDLARDGTALSAALSKLYPKHEFPPIRFRNHRREIERAKTMSRRNSPLYNVIERKICDLRARLISRQLGNLSTGA